MNLSGNVVADFLASHSVLTQDILVVVDDVYLELGTIRLRKSGGDGGHNGLKSIIYQLQSDYFPRLRFGVGNKSANTELSDYVLEKFDDEDLASIKDSIDFSTELVEKFILGGYKSMLDHYSKKFHVQRSKQDSDDDENN